MLVPSKDVATSKTLWDFLSGIAFRGLEKQIHSNNNNNTNFIVLSGVFSSGFGNISDNFYHWLVGECYLHSDYWD